MSKEKVGYLIRNGFVPYKKGEFSIQNNDETWTNYQNVLERKGNIVFANLNVYKSTSGYLTISVPYGFRPKASILTVYLYGGFVNGEANNLIAKALFKNDGSIQFCNAASNEGVETVYMAEIKNVYWETEDSINE